MNDRDPVHEWKCGQDVYCLHCDAVFKAEDVGEDSEGLPECPLCDATPLDFFPLPFWRDDLTVAVSEPEQYRWKVPAIRATPGQPGTLPLSPWDQRN